MIPSRAVLAMLTAGVLLAVATAGNLLWPGMPAGALDRLLAQIDAAGEWGAVLFAALQVAVAVSGVLPASLLGMAAGAVYGVPLGFGVAAGGTLAGAWIAFRAARLFRGRVERMLAGRPRLRDLDRRLGRENWRLVCLLRASPVMPFAVTSYTLGLSSVSPRAYMLGSLAAMPALLGYVVLGSLAHAGLRAGEAGAGPWRWLLLGFGAIATVAMTARLGRLLLRSLAVEPGAEAVPGQ